MKSPSHNLNQHFVHVFVLINNTFKRWFFSQEATDHPADQDHQEAEENQDHKDHMDQEEQEVCKLN